MAQAPSLGLFSLALFLLNRQIDFFFKVFWWSPHYKPKKSPFDKPSWIWVESMNGQEKVLLRISPRKKVTQNGDTNGDGKHDQPLTVLNTLYSLPIDQNHLIFLSWI